MKTRESEGRGQEWPLPGFHTRTSAQQEQHVSTEKRARFFNDMMLRKIYRYRDNTEWNNGRNGTALLLQLHKTAAPLDTTNGTALLLQLHKTAAPLDTTALHSS